MATHGLTGLEKIPHFKEIDIKDISIDLDCLLGSGGFGDVFKARYTGYGDTTVAVKLLRQKDISKAGIPQKDVDRFKKEAKKMFETRYSPHVVPAYGIVISKEKLTYGIVMEFMEYGSYCEFMKKGLNVPWGLRIDMLLDVACGLQDIHAKGIIHCDIKLDNVMVNHNLKAKISDFGVSQVLKSASDSLSHTQSTSSDKKTSGIGGTWTYMPPERIKSFKRKANVKTDVYSYGITSYLVLTNSSDVYDKDITYEQLKQRIGCGGWECPTDESLIENLECPVYVKDILKFVEENMLTEVPDNRKSFQEIMEFLNNYIDNYVKKSRAKDRAEMYRQLSVEEPGESDTAHRTQIAQPTDVHSNITNPEEHYGKDSMDAGPTYDEIPTPLAPSDYQSNVGISLQEGMKQLSLGPQHVINININQQGQPPYQQGQPAYQQGQPVLSTPTVNGSIRQARKEARDIVVKNITHKWKDLIRDAYDFPDEVSVCDGIDSDQTRLQDKTTEAYRIYVQKKGKEATFESLAHFLESIGLKLYGERVTDVCSKHKIPTDTTLC